MTDKQYAHIAYCKGELQHAGNLAVGDTLIFKATDERVRVECKEGLLYVDTLCGTSYIVGVEGKFTNTKEFKRCS